MFSLSSLVPQVAVVKAVAVGCLVLALFAGGVVVGRRWEVANTEQAKAALADYVAGVERDRADANAHALHAAAANGKALNVLRGQLATAEARAEDLSNRLQMELNDALPADSRPLGPAVLKYLDGVRHEQQNQSGGADAAGVPGAPAGPVGVPAGATGP